MKRTIKVLMFTKVSKTQWVKRLHCAKFPYGVNLPWNSTFVIFLFFLPELKKWPLLLMRNMQLFQPQGTLQNKKDLGQCEIKMKTNSGSCLPNITGPLDISTAGELFQNTAHCIGEKTRTKRIVIFWSSDIVFIIPHMLMTTAFIISAILSLYSSF